MTRTLILISAFALTTLGCGGDGGEGADQRRRHGRRRRDDRYRHGRGRRSGRGLEEGSIDAENGGGCQRDDGGALERGL